MSLARFATTCAVGLLLASAAVVTAQTAEAAPPTRTVAVGMDVLNTPGQTREAAISEAEASIGHKFMVTRDFLRWDSAFPTSYEKWLGARGTVPMVSIKSIRANKSVVRWGDVAAAKSGSALYSQMVSWATRARDYKYPMYFTLNHEPEASVSSSFGSAAEYVTAWRKLHDIFKSVGATNARFMWTMTSYAFQVPSTDRRYAANWYPGDSYVDGISADAYNFGACRASNGKWTSLASTISGFKTFGAKHPSKPMWFGEFGSVEGTPGQKAAWITDVQNLLRQPAYAQIAGVMYYDELQPGFSCNWPVSSSAKAQAAMKALAQDPFYQGKASFTVPTRVPASMPPVT